MPAYDFRCPSCEFVFEVMRPASDKTAVSCPQCGTEAKRVFTPVGVHFKGSGFHNTDYKPKKPSESSTAASESKSSGCPSKTDSPGCASCPASEA